ncbi:hypothetical protein [Celeribacter marinus]|uniref:Uncharacterized protein n=1 Tax=Celeribacter marinus TaxID=1397108 RepID=A0A0N7HIZ5_9RHOB|nr:hypothetical protein [Celeribacter marinus]ALI56597.1 hypothetical protein IMCC12053_2650 [Celeribacter marinus]SFK59965.1 hypothetical protein SAMN05444421_10637 [Celeribacter marinus]
MRPLQSLTLVEHLIGFGVAAALYALSFEFVVLIAQPIQQLMDQTGVLYGSLIFLPHGVRILIVWLYGWWGALYLLPIALLTYGPGDRGVALTLESIALAIAGVGATVLGFVVAKQLGVLSYSRSSNSVSWKGLFFVGAIAAGFNACFHWLLLPNPISGDMSVIFAGDILGLTVMMIGLMLTFKTLRAAGQLIK